MPIRWKVVKELERTSCMCDVPGYEKQYKVGTTVAATKDSIGIMCFKRNKDAEHFKNCYRHNNYIIIKVLGLKRGKKAPKRVGKTWDVSSLKRYYDWLRSGMSPIGFDSSDETWLTPKGTICYEQVKVLT